MGTQRETEYRATPFTVECRNAESRTIGGLGAPFNSVSEDLGGFIEVISPSFFSKGAADGFPNTISLYSHRSDMLLGAVNSGTLRLDVDKRSGLMYEVDLPRARDDVLEAIQRRDCAFSSISFCAYQDEWSDWHGQALRTLISGRLFEVGPTPQAAYSASSAAMRSLAAQVSAPVSDVLDYAERGELRSFLTRTDMRLPATQAKFISGRRKVVEALKPSQSAKRRELELMAMAPGVPQPNTAAQRRLTRQQRQLELVSMEEDPLTRQPYGYGTLSDRRKELEAMRPHKSAVDRRDETLRAYRSTL